jgi:uncharacterized protein YggT (Ycf19 family)
MALRRRRQAPAREPAADRAGVGARGAWAAGSVLVMLARLVMVAAVLVFAVIATAILLRVLDANATNTVVKDIHDVARTLVGPFHNVFKIKQPKTSIAVNWGLAALIYLVAGAVVARILGGAANRAAGYHDGRAARVN